MIPIEGFVQTYAWGLKGSKSLVARLKRSSTEAFEINELESYAELWMGTHPSGPNYITGSKVLLSDWLRDRPHLVGQVPNNYPRNNLPFLFKVLSVGTALSIQAHPNKAHAELLFKTRPDLYKDENHKPEMVVALTEFECLCGFRHVDEITGNIKKYPELHQLLLSSGFDINEKEALATSDNSSFLKDLFSYYMKSSVVETEKQLQSMITRINSQPRDKLSPVDTLMVRLNFEYPNDIGVFAPLLMNYIQMKPGESFFIGANEPHAYLAGECIECMALSDNVVRAGLTPKFKDIDTLCNMLTYKTGPPEFLAPIKANNSTSIFRPPGDLCSEFEVEYINLNPNSTHSLIVLSTASILLLIEGEDLSLLLKQVSSDFDGCLKSLAMPVGTVVFIAANATISVSAGPTNAILVRAHINMS